MKYWFIEGQTHFGVPRGPKMSSALNEPHEIGYCSSFMFTLPPSTHHHKFKKLIDIVCNTTSGKL